MRSVGVLLLSLVALGAALQHFGYGASRPSLTVSVSAEQAQAERSLTLLDVWAQSLVPTILLQKSRAPAPRDPARATRLARRLRAGLLRAEGFEAELERDPALRTPNSIDVRALQDVAAAWGDWASALLQRPTLRWDRQARLIAGLEDRAVRLHQAAYALVDDSFKTNARR